MILRPHRNPMETPLTAILVLLFSFSCLHTRVFVQADGTASFSHTIPYGQEECLLIRVPKNEPHIISGSFDCLDTRLPTDPIRVALYNSDETRVWSSNYGDAEGSFSQKGSGKHWLCLENGLTYEQLDDKKPTKPRQQVTRTIGFALRVKKSARATANDMLGDASNDGKDVDETTQNLLSLSESLNENFQVLQDHMSFMKAREMVHRELHEETFTKVVRWNIMEICTVVIVSFGQVLNVWWILSRRRNSYY